MHDFHIAYSHHDWYCTGLSFFTGQNQPCFSQGFAYQNLKIILILFICDFYIYISYHCPLRGSGWIICVD